MPDTECPCGEGILRAGETSCDACQWLAWLRSGAEFRTRPRCVAADASEYWQWSLNQDKEQLCQAGSSSANH
jgi:hypothetical protein